MKNQQNGMALIITLLVLTALSLVAVSMRNTLDVSTLAVGNVLEVQLARSVAGVSVEKLLDDLGKVDINTPSSAATLPYYSAVKLPENNAGIPEILLQKPDSNAGQMLVSSVEDNGTYQTALVLERMCNDDGDYSAAHCVNSGISKTYIPVGAVLLPTANRGQDQTNIKEGEGAAPVVQDLPLFRVTIRVDGPRNTVAFVQMFVVAQ